MLPESKVISVMFVHTSDPNLVKALLDKGYKPVCVVNERYTFIYDEDTKQTCDTYKLTSYVINHCMEF